MVVMIVAEHIMSLLSTHFPFWNSHLGSTAPPTDTTSSPFLTSDTLGANIEKCFSCVQRLCRYKILTVIHFKNVHQPSSKCIKWTCGTSNLCLAAEYHTFSNTSSGCTPGEPTHTCSCRPGRHPPWRRRWRSRGQPCGRRTGTATCPNRNQSPSPAIQLEDQDFENKSKFFRAYSGSEMLLNFMISYSILEEDSRLANSWKTACSDGAEADDVWNDQEYWCEMLWSVEEDKNDAKKSQTCLTFRLRSSWGPRAWRSDTALPVFQSSTY